MHKAVQQAVFTAAVYLAASVGGQAQQTGTIPDDVAAIIPEVMTQVNAFGRVQQSTQITANAAIDLATINDADELTKRLQDIKAYIGAVSDMIAILRAAPVLATYEARGKGLDRAQQERAFEVMGDSLEAAAATEIVLKMQGDRRYFLAWSGLLTMLRDNPDMWSPEDGNSIPISFTSADFESVIWAQIDMILLAEKNTNQKAVDVDAARPAEN